MLNTKIIGNKIAEARKKLNISQAQLAERMFISSQAVGKWERGESMPDITTINRLAEIFGVDLNFFSEKFQSASTEIPNAEPLNINSSEMPSSEVKKPKWNMSQGNWVDADFSGLKNLHEKFSSSNMQRCKFIGSDLAKLLLKSNNLDACDFSNSDISFSNIQNSNLEGNIFKNCVLTETEFSGSNIGSCDFSGADFTAALYKSSNFSKNNISNSVFNRVSFIGVNIDETVFETNLDDCYFENCAFYKVTFQNAILKNTFFKNNKNLKRIKFIDCKADRITYEFLKSGKADLSGITIE